MRPGMMRTIRIGFTILDRSQTAIDPDFRAPTGNPVWKDEVKVRGVIRYIKKEGFRQFPGGDEPLADGRILVWQDDLTEIGIMPQKGDRITSVHGDTVDWTVIEVRTQIHMGGTFQAKLFFFKMRTK